MQFAVRVLVPPSSYLEVARPCTQNKRICMALDCNVNGEEVWSGIAIIRACTRARECVCVCVCVCVSEKERDVVERVRACMCVSIVCNVCIHVL